MRARELPTIIFEKLASSQLALVLVALVILFSLGGAILPQEGQFEVAEILSWQAQKPSISNILEPLGFFHVFNSIPFLVTIFFLGVNTLTCTILRFVREGGFASLKGPKAIPRIGFLVIHLSLILLFAGCFLTSAKSLNGNILLTEGQTFVEKHNGYLKIAEGPLRQKKHKEFTVRLKKVQKKYEKKHYLIDVKSELEILSNGEKVTDGFARINYPFIYQGIAITQDETGFAPRLEIRDERKGRLLVNSFIALKTFKGKPWDEYKDFLPVPFFKNRVIITLIPEHIMEDGKAVKTGEEPVNPILLVEMENKNGKVVSKSYIPLGKKISIGKYSFAFTDLRRWSVFKVSDDPGYITVCIALWTGLIALILRYFQDIRRWFRWSPTEHDEA